MIKAEIIQTSFIFEKFIAELFENAGYQIRLNVPIAYPSDFNPQKILGDIDIIAESDNEKYYIEVKYSTVKIMRSTDIYRKSAERIWRISQSENATPILIYSGIIPEELKEQYQKSFTGLIVLDIKNLLYSVRNMADFRDRLVSMLPFVIDDIEPIEIQYP